VTSKEEPFYFALNGAAAFLAASVLLAFWLYRDGRTRLAVFVGAVCGAPLCWSAVIALGGVLGWVQGWGPCHGRPGPEGAFWGVFYFSVVFSVAALAAGSAVGAAGGL